MLMITTDFQVEFAPFNSTLAPIMTPWYLERDTDFKYENIFWMAELMEKHMIPSKFSASWALARLYYLFDSNLLQALNIDLDKENQQVGLQDGGYFYADGYVKSANNEIVGHIYLEGKSGYVNLNLVACSDQYFPSEILDKLCHLIWDLPLTIKPCHIIIKDPEQNAKEFHYGWNGSTYFYTED